jgi:hypothetical protein
MLRVMARPLKWCNGIFFQVIGIDRGVKNDDEEDDECKEGWMTRNNGDDSKWWE